MDRNSVFSNFVAMKMRLSYIAILITLLGCASGKGADSSADSAADENPALAASAFSADSAYRYVERQVEFGPRVPNTEAHRQAADWLSSELKRHGAQVVEQALTLKAFDGTSLKARNIMGRYNPDSAERILLLAHWDCRPWADEDPDETRHAQPVDGANDGASGVGVLLEIARQLGVQSPNKGVDILFVDAEDWGSAGDDESWALGAKAFAQNPPIADYAPREAILLDMVGGPNATFCREYFSEQGGNGLNTRLWTLAAQLGLDANFPNREGSAITDDHIPLIQAGIPAVDIIEYNAANGGFNPRWHTASDNMEGISSSTLDAVGKVVMTYLRQNY